MSKHRASASERTAQPTRAPHSAGAGKHRHPLDYPVAAVSKRAVKATVLVSALAVAGTGTAVASGVAFGGHGAGPSIDLADSAATHLVTRPAHRAAAVSRDLDRAELTRAVVTTSQTKAALLSTVGDDSSAVTGTAGLAPVAGPVTPGTAQAIAEALLPSYGWDDSQMGCLVDLWNRESNWSTTAENPSGAYGIPQALPGDKMATAGADWRTDAATQIKWGLGYIADRYGSPCGAWDHSEADGWY